MYLSFALLQLPGDVWGSERCVNAEREEGDPCSRLLRYIYRDVTRYIVF